MRRRRVLTDDARHVRSIAQKVARAALPLRNTSDLDPLLERIGDARVVLLGEASHGTPTTTPGAAPSVGD